MKIRAATREDLSPIGEIYGHYVRTTPATFDLEPPPLEAWQEEFEEHVAAGPYDLLVAVAHDTILGWAKTGPWRERKAYATSAQVTAYCAPGATRRGIGRALYEELFRVSGARGFHRAYAAITLPNDASAALHERFGFTHIGTMHEVGSKFGRYWDVAQYEKEL